VGGCTRALPLTGRRSTRIEVAPPRRRVGTLGAPARYSRPRTCLLRALRRPRQPPDARGAAFQVGAAIRLLRLELGSDSWDAIPGVRSLEARAQGLERRPAAGARRQKKSPSLEAMIDAVDAGLERRRYAASE